MSKCQYTSDVRQSVNRIIQDAYKKTQCYVRKIEALSGQDLKDILHNIET